jgi:hypothetical protein
MRPRWQRSGRIAGALLAPVVLAAWPSFGSYARFMVALDPGSAVTTCSTSDGVKPLCDFANHYYPQGRALMIVHGFYYSAFFAVCMRAFAAASHGTAALLWATVVVIAALTLILAPLLRELRGALLGALVHGSLFAGLLPLWHDLAFGQVSSLLTALLLLAFFAYGRDRRGLAGLLLGVASSIKLYPALFAVLISVPLLLLVGASRFYTSALPFWATALLLPGLYHRVWKLGCAPG